MKGLIIVSGIIGLLIGAGFGGWMSDWRSARYQAVRLDDRLVVRLNTKTGEMKTFMAKNRSHTGPLDIHLVGLSRSIERRVSPDEIQVVTNLAAVEKCTDFGYFGEAEDTKEAVNRGGDTLYRGKNRAGEERSWLYRCTP